MQYLRDVVDGRIRHALYESVGDCLAYGRMEDEQFTADITKLVLLALTDHRASIEGGNLWDFYGPSEDAEGPTWWEATAAEIGAALDEALHRVYAAEEMPGPLFVILPAVLKRYADFAQEDGPVGSPWWRRWWSAEEGLARRARS